MCGLTYYHQTQSKSVGKSVLKRYHKQKERGQEGYGFISLDLETLRVGQYVRKELEEDIVKELLALKERPEKNNAILFHHRNPTSTVNLPECAHPIKVDNPELEHIYFVAHNGIISNTRDLKKQHEKLGYKYNTELSHGESWTTIDDLTYTTLKDVMWNDSESVAIELARFIEGKAEKVEADGSMALIALQVSREGKAIALYYGRNYQSPLYLEQDQNSFCLKSVGSFFKSVDVDKLYRLGYAEQEITVKECDFGQSYYQWNVGYKTKLENKKEKEDVVLNAPTITTEAYFKEVSAIEFDIDTWLDGNYDFETQQQEAANEFYLVEELLEWEKKLNVSKDDIERLEKRLKQLDQRVDLLDKKIIDEEELAYGLHDEVEAELERERQTGFNTMDF